MAEGQRQLHIGKPRWLKTRIPTGDTFFSIKRDLRARNLFTVCEEAKCPNIGECWNTRTATFMILGDTCTRACRFCNVKTGNPAQAVSAKEAEETAAAAKVMGLRYAVITMVDRDDLEDGGAAHVAHVLNTVRRENEGIILEVLAGDFSGRERCINAVLEARPEVYAHNLETIERLTPRVRDARASYGQSLGALTSAKRLGPTTMMTKSALMLGLGEERHEISQTFRDLRAIGVDLVTIGQYMRPTRQHLSIKRFVPPEEFAEIGTEALEMGFLGVASAPLVRSSYRAREFYEQAIHKIERA